MQKTEVIKEAVALLAQHLAGVSRLPQDSHKGTH
jgi:hypothetical protein